MDKFDRKLIYAFTEPLNKRFLHSYLVRHFERAVVTQYLHGAMDMHFDNFVEFAEKDLMYGNVIEPDYEVDKTSDRLICLNSKFLRYMISIIDDFLLDSKRKRELSTTSDYYLSDGLTPHSNTIISSNARSIVDDNDTSIVDDQFVRWGANSDNWQSLAKTTNNTSSAIGFKRRSKYGCYMTGATESADKELENFKYTKRGGTFRDDTISDFGTGEGGSRSSLSRNDNRANFDIGTGYQYQGINLDNGDFNDPFTGDSPENTTDHLERALYTPYIIALNSDNDTQNVLSSTYARGKYGEKKLSVNNPSSSVKLWSDGNSFVDLSDPVKMEEFYSKRSFRSFNNPATKSRNGQGATRKCDSTYDQIPWYRKALHKRMVDRDATETLGGNEREGKLHGYDMSRINCKSRQAIPCTGKLRGQQPQYEKAPSAPARYYPTFEL